MLPVKLHKTREPTPKTNTKEGTQQDLPPLNNGKHLGKTPDNNHSAFLHYERGKQVWRRGIKQIVAEIRHSVRGQMARDTMAEIDPATLRGFTLWKWQYQAYARSVGSCIIYETALKGENSIKANKTALSFTCYNCSDRERPCISFLLCLLNCRLRLRWPYRDILDREDKSVKSHRDSISQVKTDVWTANIVQFL